MLLQEERLVCALTLQGLRTYSCVDGMFDPSRLPDGTLVFYQYAVCYWLDGQSKCYLSGYERPVGPSYCIGALRNRDEILEDDDIPVRARMAVYEEPDQWLWVIHPDGYAYQLEEGSRVIATPAEFPGLAGLSA